MYATGSYFTTLGVGAFAGRVFTAADDRAAAEPVAVMSYNACRTSTEATPQWLAPR
jgi:hypothetical protein